MSLSPGLALYLGLSRFSEGWAERHLQKRLGRGKEHAERLPERLGHASVDRPEGPLVWLHAASVGESLSVLEVIACINADYPDITVLVTTGTVTSADLMQKRLSGMKALHQFAPLDSLPVIERFLAHWKPDLAIWTESEFWPATLYKLHLKKVPLVLINARMSERSARSWRWHPLFSRSILRRFRLILAQDDTTARRLYKLGAYKSKTVVTGSLKEGSAPLPHDAATLKGLIAALDGRPCWLAASTHPGEEAIITAAHKEARRTWPGLCLILVPRHPERGDEIAQALAAENWTVHRRSNHEQPASDTDIYLADTLGEMGLWYRLAPVSVVCGSFAEIGGHNPYEPAALGSAILTGPHIANFQEVYDKMQSAGAVRIVERPEDLPAALTETLSPDKSAELAANAWDLQSSGARITDDVMGHLAPYLETAGVPR